MGYAEGFNSGFDAGLAKFEFVVAAMFFSLLINALANNSWIRSKLGRRLCDFLATTGFTVGFVGAGFLFLQIFLPLIKVSVGG